MVYTKTGGRGGQIQTCFRIIIKWKLVNFFLKESPKQEQLLRSKTRSEHVKGTK